MQREAAAVSADLGPLISALRLLSDPTRLNILMILAKGERNVTSLCKELKLPQPTVSHHLGLLRDNQLISNRRNGKQIFYALNGQVEAGSHDRIDVNCSPFTIRISQSGRK